MESHPYDQLADCYLHAGHDGRVLLAKQRHRRTTLSAPGRAASGLLDAIVSYGYRPWLAAIWLAVLLTADTIVYAIDRLHAPPGGSVPPFNAFTYTLDLLIPIGASRLRNAYASAGPGPMAGRRPHRRLVDTRHRRHHRRHPHCAPRLTN